MQAIYQWLVNEDTPVKEIEKHFADDQDMQSANAEFFADLLTGVTANQEQLAQLLAPHVSRPLN